jgi:hypothetical protein
VNRVRSTAGSDLMRSTRVYSSLNELGTNLIRLTLCVVGLMCIIFMYACV